MDRALRRGRQRVGVAHERRRAGELAYGRAEPRCPVTGPPGDRRGEAEDAALPRVDVPIGDEGVAEDLVRDADARELLAGLPIDRAQMLVAPRQEEHPGAHRRNTEGLVDDLGPGHVAAAGDDQLGVGADAPAGGEHGDRQLTFPGRADERVALVLLAEDDAARREVARDDLGALVGEDQPSTHLGRHRGLDRLAPHDLAAVEIEGDELRGRPPEGDGHGGLGVGGRTVDAREDGGELLGAVVGEREAEGPVGPPAATSESDDREEGDDDGALHRMILSAALVAASRSERVRRFSGRDSARSWRNSPASCVASSAM